MLTTSAALTVLAFSPLTVADADRLPSDLASAFVPPQEFANRLGEFRSVLVFEDGTTVDNQAEWLRRRKEILRSWHEVMGSWPELVPNPRIERLGSTDRDGFKQHRVNVEIARGRFASGLVAGAGRRRAISRRARPVL
jgi:hypothetical protein